MEIQEQIKIWMKEAEDSLMTEKVSFPSWDKEDSEITEYWNVYKGEWAPIKSWAIKGYVHKKIEDLLNEMECLRL